MCKTGNKLSLALCKTRIIAITQKNSQHNKMINNVKGENSQINDMTLYFNRNDTVVLRTKHVLKDRTSKLVVRTLNYTFCCDSKMI